MAALSLLKDFSQNLLLWVSNNYWRGNFSLPSMKLIHLPPDVLHIVFLIQVKSHKNIFGFPWIIMETLLLTGIMKCIYSWIKNQKAKIMCIFLPLDE